MGVLGLIAMGNGAVTADQLRAMLGLADRGRTSRLLGAVLEGDAPAALAALATAADAGVEPSALFEGLMDLVHGITRARMSGVDDPALSEEERAAVRQWAERLGFPQLHRLWQLLLKGHADIGAAPDPGQAADMALLRIIHAGDLPDPDTLARLVAGEVASGSPPATARSDAPVAGRARQPADFAAIVSLAESHREALLAKQLHDDVACRVFAPGHLTLAACRPLPQDFARTLARLLSDWTGREWQVLLEPRGPDDRSLREAQQMAEADLRITAEMDPRVDALLQAFPGAEIAGTSIVNPLSHKG